jgi:hypothetical protein
MQAVAVERLAIVFIPASSSAGRQILGCAEFLVPRSLFHHRMAK